MRLRLVIATTLIAVLITLTLGGSGALGVACLEFVEHAWAPALWMAAAVGYGALLQRMLRSRVPGTATDSWALAACLGIAIHLWLDEVAGCLGAPRLSGAVYALIDALGVALVVFALRRRMPTGPVNPSGVRLLAILTCLVPLGTTLVAALSTPGYLWRSEFGGYDALSYHLQLPKEWLELGQITPLWHNAYSALPGYVEAAFLHLFAIRGSAHAGAVDAQLLSAAFVVVAAGAVAEAARAGIAGLPGTGCRSIGAPLLAAIVFLGIPWVTVTGSLAYDESAVCAMIAGALALALDGSGRSSRNLAAVGVLIGGAVTAKASAAGVASLPIAVLALAFTPRPWRESVAGCGVLVAAGMLMIAPWLVRNAVVIGEPLFPLAGDGWWTPDQALRFAAGHAPPPMSEWAGSIWNQLVRFGIGPDPQTGDVWLPQWSVLWALAVAAATGLVLRPGPLRRPAMALSVALVLSLAFWLFLTHQKSRFMLPAAPLAAVLVGWGAARLEVIRWGQLASVGLALVGLAWSLGPVLSLADEGNGQPLLALGARGVMDGTARPAEAAAGELGPAAVANQLPPMDRVACLGLANVFWFRLTPQYATVWDTGPIDGWPASLSEHGFTVLMVQNEMLDLWNREGWIDPAVGPEARAALVSRLPGRPIPTLDQPSPWRAFRLRAD